MTVEFTKLSNGITVVTHRMEALETASLGVWVRVGARDEPAELNGVSHMLEHMAFKGTAQRSARAIAEEIEAVGGHLNAFTSREVTAYLATVLKDDIALAIDLIADILQRSVFDPEELDRERHVVLQEIGQAHDTPEDVIFDLFQERAFPDQPVGRPILGPPEIVAAFERDQLIDYMRTHYTAPRMVVGAAGRLDHDDVVALVERKFDAVASGEDRAPPPAAYAGGEVRAVRPLEQVHLVLGFDGVGYHDPEYYAMGVASMILGGGMSSRLFQEIRETRGLVYSIYSFSSSYTDGGLFGIYAGTGADGLGELLPVLCDELGRAAEKIGDAELSRAKAQLRAGIVMSLESTQSRAEQLARQVAIFGAPIPIDELVRRIEAVGEASVRRAITRLLASTPTVAAIGPVGNMESFETIAGRLTHAA